MMGEKVPAERVLSRLASGVSGSPVGHEVTGPDRAPSDVVTESTALFLPCRGGYLGGQWTLRRACL